MSRILLSAYACEPGKGSEPEVGWMWATELAAAGHEVWVITRTANRPAIKEVYGVLASGRLHFAYYDLPAWILRWKRGDRGVHWYYACWQWGAYRLAKRLTRSIRFDCVQHVTFVGVRAPSFMGLLEIPFYMGPVSGGECVPRHLREDMSRRARWCERLREVANRIIHFDPVMRSSFRRAERIMVATSESRQLIPRAFRRRCSVQLGVGLSSEYLAWSSANRPAPKGDLRLVYAGRLLEWKGLDLALRAVAGLRDLGIRTHLTVIGDGPAARSLKELTAELDMQSSVHWVSWTPRDRLHEHYSQNDVLLFPSLRDSGGMVVLEALAHGVPVVCTDRGGPGSIVNDRCGRVVRTSGSTRAELVQGLTAAVAEISRDRVLWKKLSAGARARAWEFDFRNVVAQVHPRD